MKPGGAGVVDQMIEEPMDFEAFVVAPSIGAYFEWLGELLDSGIVTHDPRQGFLQAGKRLSQFRMFPSAQWGDAPFGD